MFAQFGFQCFDLRSVFPFQGGEDFFRQSGDSRNERATSVVLRHPRWAASTEQQANAFASLRDNCPQSSHVLIRIVNADTHSFPSSVFSQP